MDVPASARCHRPRRLALVRRARPGAARIGLAGAYMDALGKPARAHRAHSLGDARTHRRRDRRSAHGSHPPRRARGSASGIVDQPRCPGQSCQCADDRPSIWGRHGRRSGVVSTDRQHRSRRAGRGADRDPRAGLGCVVARRGAELQPRRRGDRGDGRRQPPACRPSLFVYVRREHAPRRRGSAGGMGWPDRADRSAAAVAAGGRQPGQCAGDRGDRAGIGAGRVVGGAEGV